MPGLTDATCRSGAVRRTEAMPQRCSECSIAGLHRSHSIGNRAVEKRWIWPFELLDKLGEGGMGVVYRARYVVDNRHVAVKLLPPDVANATILSRFERELEILKTLRHPNIVRSFRRHLRGKPALLRDGTCRRGNARQAARRAGQVLGGSRRSIRAANGLGPGVRARARRRPSRRQAGQLSADDRGQAEAERLRAGDGRSGHQDHRGRQDDGHVSLHGSGANPRPAAGLAADRSCTRWGASFSRCSRVARRSSAIRRPR